MASRPSLRGLASGSLRGRHRITIAIYAVAALLIGVTGLATLTVADTVRADASARYADSLDVALESLHDGLTRVEASLVALRILFAGSNEVTAEEFARAVADTSVFENVPAAREFRYFTAQADRSFRPAFAVDNMGAALAGSTPDLSLVSAAGAALDSGEYEATPPLQLADGSRQVLVVLRAMQGANPGIVAVSVDVDTLVGETQMATFPVHIEDAGILVYGPPQIADAAVERSIAFGGREWRLMALQETDSRTGIERGLPALVALVGLAVTIVVTWLLLWLRRSLARARELSVALASSEQEMRFRALHDPLTGLANRTLFEDRLHHALEAQRRRRNRTALLYCDLDTFKVINDDRGHEVGDAVLVETAKRMLDAVRASDTVARMGGDEFCVLLEEVSGPEEALGIASRIRAGLADPIQLEDGTSVASTVSIGAAVSGAEPADDALLIREADAAMYRAKQAGRDRVILVDLGATAAVRARI